MAAAIHTDGRELATIKLHYCSSVGLVYAGIFSAVTPREFARKRMLMTRRINEFKLGPAQVAADAAKKSLSKKIRCVPAIDGLPFGLAYLLSAISLTLQVWLRRKG